LAELDLAGINADLSDLGPFDIDMLGIENFKVDVTEILEEEKSTEDKVEKKCPACGEILNGG
jgi:hypothetical protein